MYIYIFLMLHITYPYISIHVYLYIDNRLRSILISMQILPYSELHLFTYYRSFSPMLFIRAFHPCISSVFFTSVGIYCQKAYQPINSSVHCTMRIQCTLFIVHCIIYIFHHDTRPLQVNILAQCTLYSVQCTVYINNCIIQDCMSID